jgi:hypothetical protein
LHGVCFKPPVVESLHYWILLNFTKAITLPPQRYPRYWMPSPLAWAPWSTLFAHMVIESSEGKTKRQDASIRSTAVSCLVVVAYALQLPRLTKQQQQQQHSLLSQTSWGRLEMKPKRDEKHQG